MDINFVCQHSALNNPKKYSLSEIHSVNKVCECFFHCKVMFHHCNIEISQIPCDIYVKKDLILN